MEKKNRGIGHIIIKNISYLTVRQWIGILISSLLGEGLMFLFDILIIQVIIGMILGVALLAIIVILVNSKKIEKLIFIESKKPILREVCGEGMIGDGTPCYYIINFPLFIDSKTPLTVSVKSMNCNFLYNGVIMQNIKVQDGDIFATNGIAVDLVTIEGLGNNDQICPFNTFPYHPTLPTSNEWWQIKGEITIIPIRTN